MAEDLWAKDLAKERTLIVPGQPGVEPEKSTKMVVDKPQKEDLRIKELDWPDKNVVFFAWCGQKSQDWEMLGSLLPKSWGLIKRAAPFWVSESLEKAAGPRKTWLGDGTENLE